MIDLHLHLLPGVDDGAASPEISRTMIERAADFGFTALVATPHLSGPLAPRYEQSVREALSTVLSDNRELPVSIELGYEIQLSPDLPARLKAGEQSRLAGSSAVLVELPFSGWPLFTEQTLFELQSLGFRPLLAHPERYAAVQAEPEKAIALAERGVMMQVTIGSLVGLFGKSAQRVAEHLVRTDAATVLASDAHSAGQRFMSVGDGLARAEAMIGPDRTRQLVYDNPKALLEGRPLPPIADHVVSESEDKGWRKAFQRASSRIRN